MSIPRAPEKLKEPPDLREAMRAALGLTSPRMRRRRSAREKLGLPERSGGDDGLLEAAIDVVYCYKDAPCLQSGRGRDALALLERIVRERAGE